MQDCSIENAALSYCRNCYALNQRILNENLHLFIYEEYLLTLVNSVYFRNAMFDQISKLKYFLIRNDEASMVVCFLLTTILVYSFCT